MSDKDKKLEESYKELVKRAEEARPGINDLLSLYGELQSSLKASQDYLNLFNRSYATTNSNNTTR
ncbi:MAG: hypothetical protein AAB393_01350 [Bacteroidota bacterium]